MHFVVFGASGNGGGHFVRLAAASRAQVGFQMVLIAWTAFVGALASSRVRTLVRR